MTGVLWERNASCVKPLSECGALRVISGLVLGGGSGGLLNGECPGGLNCVQPMLTVKKGFAQELDQGDAEQRVGGGERRVGTVGVFRADRSV